MGSTVCIIVLVILWLRYQIIVADREAKSRELTRINDKVRVQEILSKRELEYRQGSASSSVRRGTETLKRKVPVIRKKVNPLDVPVALANKIPSNDVMNVAPNPSDTRWFLCPHKDLPAPSAAESLIIEELNKYNIEWHREVSFKGLQFTPYSYPRFDFYLPDINTILEYDSVQYHASEQNKNTDAAKTKFCIDNEISIIRLNRKHYYKMSETISGIMREYDVKLK